MTRTTTADQGLVGIPTLTPHLQFHKVGEEQTLLVSESFNTLLNGKLNRDLLPLLDGRTPLDEIAASLEGVHAASDVLAAVAAMSSKGYVVSADHGMARHRAAYWSSLGASPRWVEQRLAETRIAVEGDDGTLARHFDRSGVRVGTGDPMLTVVVCEDNRLRMPAVDLASFEDEYLASAPDHYARYERDLWMLDVTADVGIPTFVALSRRPDAPTEDIIYGAGSHADPRIAALRAICELNQCLTWLPRPGASDGRPMIDDPMALWWWRTARLADCSWLQPATDAPLKKGSQYPLVVRLFRQMETEGSPLREIVGRKLMLEYDIGSAGHGTSTFPGMFLRPGERPILGARHAQQRHMSQFEIPRPSGRRVQGEPRYNAMRPLPDLCECSLATKNPAR